MSRFARIVTFHGTVQGVGFRRRAARIAEEHPVGGYVRNLPDGSVEMFVEGNEEQCETYVDHVKRVMCNEIVSFDTRIASPLGLSEFEIRY
jgi:acylphosphatase